MSLYRRAGTEAAAVTLAAMSVVRTKRSDYSDNGGGER